MTASTLTVLAALQAAFYVIKSYRDAPSQLEALNNEIVDSIAAVTEVARVIKEYQNKTGLLGERSSHLTTALSNIRKTARKLEVILRSCIGQSSSTSGGTQVSRVAWFKVKSNVQSLQTELRGKRLDLSIAVAALNASVLPSTIRSVLIVDDLVFEV